MSVVFDERDVRVHAVGDVVAMVWHAAPTERVVLELEKALRVFHDAHAGGAALIVVPRVAAPDERARNALQEMTKRIGSSVVGAAVLLELDGLRGKVLRGVVNGVIGAMKLPFPVTLVESARTATDHALRLLRAKGRSGPTAREVEDTLVELQKPKKG
jgi:hypothetical protein